MATDGIEAVFLITHNWGSAQGRHEAAVQPDPVVEVVTPFQDTHFGTGR